MRMLNKLVMIKAIEHESTTKGGLIVAIASQKNLPYKKGDILKVAKDCVQPIKVKDKVLYLLRGVVSPNVEIDGHLYDLVKEDGLLMAL